MEKQNTFRIFNELNKRNMNEYKKELEKGQSDFVILLLVFIPLLPVFELLKSIFTTKSK